MEEKIEIMHLIQDKQILERELSSLLYGTVEIRENNSNKYIEDKIKKFIKEKCYMGIN